MDHHRFAASLLCGIVRYSAILGPTLNLTLDNKPAALSLCCCSSDHHYIHCALVP